MFTDNTDEGKTNIGTGTGKDLTYFADPARRTQEEITGAREQILGNQAILDFLSVADTIAIVLNDRRQIIAANPITATLLGVKNGATLLGMRPGEAFACVSSKGAPNGCGTSSKCGDCGAVITLLEARGTGTPCVGECAIHTDHDGHTVTLEFDVLAIPMNIAGHKLVLVTLSPTS